MTHLRVMFFIAVIFITVDLVFTIFSIWEVAGSRVLKLNDWLIFSYVDLATAGALTIGAVTYPIYRNYKPGAGVKPFAWKQYFPFRKCGVMYTLRAAVFVGLLQYITNSYSDADIAQLDNDTGSARVRLWMAFSNALLFFLATGLVSISAYAELMHVQSYPLASDDHAEGRVTTMTLVEKL